MKLLIIKNGLASWKHERELETFLKWHRKHLGELEVTVVEESRPVRTELSSNPRFPGHAKIANAIEFLRPGYDVTAVLWDAPHKSVSNAWHHPSLGIVCEIALTGARDLFRVLSHEIIHGYWWKAEFLGYPRNDTMDVYDREFQPLAKNGNRARNIAALAPYMSAVRSGTRKTAPQSPAKPASGSGVLSALYEALRGAQEALAKLTRKPDLPSGYEQIVAKYGDTSSPTFERDSIVLFDLPYPLLYQGKKVHRSRAHRLAVPNFVKALTLIRDRGLTAQVSRYSGIYAPRPQRNSGKLSTHAWGIAIDVEAERLPQGTRDRFSPEVLACFAEAGFVSGADFPTPDPMHFQLARDY